MPRTNRIAPGDWVFHVLNRGNARMEIFRKDADYAAFRALLAETLERFRMRLLSYCLMPNHWHLVLWPREDGDLSSIS
jgi:putative transposase